MRSTPSTLEAQITSKQRKYEKGWGKLIEDIKTVGYVPDTDSIHDVKAQLLNTHNEKLGMAA
jgi:hypothetical protein